MNKTFFLILAFSFTSGTSFAACTGIMTAQAGQVTWCPGQALVAYCDGTNWQSMKRAVSQGACTVAGKTQVTGSDISFCDGSNLYRMNDGNNLVNCPTQYQTDWSGTYVRACVPTPTKYQSMGGGGAITPCTL